MVHKAACIKYGMLYATQFWWTSNKLIMSCIIIIIAENFWWGPNSTIWQIWKISLSMHSNNFITIHLTANTQCIHCLIFNCSFCMNNQSVPYAKFKNYSFPQDFNINFLDQMFTAPQKIQIAVILLGSCIHCKLQTTSLTDKINVPCSNYLWKIDWIETAI